MATMDMGIKVCNANYERVLQVLGKLVQDRYRHICTCDRCASDIAAIALNYLPPHYYVDTTVVGQEKEMGSPWIMVETAVQEAIDRVQDSPNHASQTERYSVAAGVTAPHIS